MNKIEQLRQSTGYGPEADGPVDDLIAYKDALEDLVGAIDEAALQNSGAPEAARWREKTGEAALSAGDVCQVLFELGLGDVPAEHEDEHDRRERELVGQIERGHRLLGAGVEPAGEPDASRVDDHSASRRSDVLAERAPHLLGHDPNAAGAGAQVILEETEHLLGELPGGAVEQDAPRARVLRIRRVARTLLGSLVVLGPTGPIVGPPAEVTNEDRRLWARAALEAYRAQPGLDTGEERTTLVDLLADLLHLGDELGVGGLLDSAERHYREEVAEER